MYIENRLKVVRGRGLGNEWEVEISRYRLLYMEWINHKVLLYSAGNYIQYTMIDHNKKEYEKECMYIHIYVQLNHFFVQQKLTQHCKSTTLQQKQ